ncbi:MAG: hypothetical protein FVQ79_10175 [Planctomycetes bacterium]|nr:hypothetical protein [Planctomycetota bacterium]
MHKKCVIVLICLLMFGNLTHGAVICIGANGHISLELTSADCCDESPAILLSCSIDNQSETTDSCGDCIDIPLPGSCESKRLTSFVTKGSSRLNILPQTIIAVYTDNTVSTDKERFANHVSDSLFSIRTTVLIV